MCNRHLIASHCQCDRIEARFAQRLASASTATVPKVNSCCNNGSCCSSCTYRNHMHRVCFEPRTLTTSCSPQLQEQLLHLIFGLLQHCSSSDCQTWSPVLMATGTACRPLKPTTQTPSGYQVVRSSHCAPSGALQSMYVPQIAIKYQFLVLAVIAGVMISKRYNSSETCNGVIACYFTVSPFLHSLFYGRNVCACSHKFCQQQILPHANLAIGQNNIACIKCFMEQRT